MKATARFVAVRNYETLQHYKDRNPPWIKLYARLLDDTDFERLPEATRGHLMLIWLLASRMDNRIPADPAYIAKKIGAKRIQFDLLLAEKWLVPVEASAAQPASTPLAPDASTPLAPRYQSASPRALARGEERREEKRRGGPASIALVENGGDGGQILAQIRGLIEVHTIPGRADSRTIPLAAVAALGDDVLAAYHVIGGPDRIFETEPKNYGFLVRDFTAALSRARACARDTTTNHRATA